jgi:hypothetical protein
VELRCVQPRGKPNPRYVGTFWKTRDGKGGRIQVNQGDEEVRRDKERQRKYDDTQESANLKRMVAALLYRAMFTFFSSGLRQLVR